MDEEKNSTQDKDISSIQTDLRWMKTDINSIKRQVFNHIPTAIRGLKQEFYDYKLSNSKWSISILVTLIFVLVALVANLIVM